MTVLIISVVIVFCLSVYGAYEVGRYERRNRGVIIDNEWWMDNIKNVDLEGFKHE